MLHQSLLKTTELFRSIKSLEVAQSVLKEASTITHNTISRSQSDSYQTTMAVRQPQSASSIYSSRHQHQTQCAHRSPSRLAMGRLKEPKARNLASSSHGVMSTNRARNTCSPISRTRSLTQGHALLPAKEHMPIKHQMGISPRRLAQRRKARKQ